MVVRTDSSEPWGLLLRDIFRAAGGSHEDWDEYDRVTAAERRAAVLITPGQVYTNPQAWTELVVPGVIGSAECGQIG